jgi:hypothetical protein
MYDGDGGFGAFVRDWWTIGVFMAGLVVSYIAGRERQRYRIDDLYGKVKAQDARLKVLEDQGQAEAITLAEIRVQQVNILAALSEIKDALARKADK